MPRTSFVFVLALAGSLSAGAAAAKSFCDYAAGETLTTGPLISDVRSDCSWWFSLADCRTRTTEQFFSCVDVYGHATNSGILRVVARGSFSPYSSVHH